MRKFALLLALWGRFRREARMVWGMLRDPATPPVAKLVAVLALAYVLSPVDLVPDVLPIAGWIDDGVVLTALLALAYRLLPRELHDSLRRRASRSGETIDGEATRVG